MLLDLVTQIQDTQKEIATLESALSRQPDSFALRLSLGSLHARQKELNRRFTRCAHEEQQNVCSYRFIPESDGQPILWLGKIMSDFQTLFSLVYDSLRSGQPKQRGTYRKLIAEETTLSFSHSFAGSVGFVFTLPKINVEKDKAFHEEAIKTIFNMAQAHESKEILGLSDTFGVATIKKMYEWVKDHVEGDMSAEIKWTETEEVMESEIIQLPKFRALQLIFEQTSEIEESEFSARGILSSGNTGTRSFGFNPEGSRELISGKISEDFVNVRGVKPGELLLGRQYEARIGLKEKTFICTDKKQRDYMLLALTAIESKAS